MFRTHFLCSFLDDLYIFLYSICPSPPVSTAFDSSIHSLSSHDINLSPLPPDTTMPDSSIHSPQLLQCQPLSITPRYYNARPSYTKSPAPSMSVSIIPCSHSVSLNASLVKHVLWFKISFGKRHPTEREKNIYQLFICQEINIQNT